MCVYIPFYKPTLSLPIKWPATGPDLLVHRCTHGDRVGTLPRCRKGAGGAIEVFASLNASEIGNTTDLYEGFRKWGYPKMDGL